MQLAAAFAAMTCSATMAAGPGRPLLAPRVLPVPLVRRRSSAPAAIVPLNSTDSRVCNIDERCIFFVTGNAKKELEVNSMLRDPKNDIAPYRLTHVDIDLPELQGQINDAGALDIARAKCMEASRQVGGSAVIVEDTSLCFGALNGLPGPYIKWFWDSLGNDGLWRMLESCTDQSAFCRCVLAYSPGEEEEPLLFVGTTHGKIVAPSGDGGFGWDAIFVPDGYDTPFAVMPLAEKNKISHRSRALMQFIEHCQEEARAEAAELW